jgi:phosphoserine phosphatase RsbU/P
MSESRAYLRSIIQYESEPRTVLNKLNSQILPDLIEDSNFVTTMIARLHPESHILEYANAGNWPAYILDRQGKVLHELRTGGPPIGAVSDLVLRPAEPISLAPGCLIVFLTDGIPEASDPAFQEFGVERLLAVIRSHQMEPAREIINRVREAVQDYMSSNPQADDHTIIICKRLE